MAVSPPFSRPTLNLVAAGLLLAVGLVHGRWTGRWSVSTELTEAVARLARVPDRVGEWSSRPVDLEARQVERAGIVGYVARRYEAKGRTPVTVLLVCGPPGPIAVHSPDVCYQGAGYEPITFPVPTDLPYGTTGKVAGILEGVYTKPKAGGSESLRVDWTFKVLGPWRAPTNPRLTFASERALYKLYLIQDGRPTEPGKAAGSMDFARAFLPALDEALVPAPPLR